MCRAQSADKFNGIVCLLSRPSPQQLVVFKKSANLIGVSTMREIRTNGTANKNILFKIHRQVIIGKQLLQKRFSIKARRIAPQCFRQFLSPCRYCSASGAMSSVASAWGLAQRFWPLVFDLLQGSEIGADIINKSDLILSSVSRLERQSAR